MNVFALICLTLAAGATALMFYAGQAILAWAKRPRHQHTWETDRIISVWMSEDALRPAAELYVLRCTGCGDIRKRKVKS